MLSSGVTYERQIIVLYFERKRRDANQEDSDYDMESHFLCPVSQIAVNPDIIIANKRIAAATQHFIEENPWAHNYNPN